MMVNNMWGWHMTINNVITKYKGEKTGGRE